MEHRQALGQWAESKALEYLTLQGLTLIERNYRCKRGEIDLILRTQEYVIFVEVRSREQSTLLELAESITRRKQRKIITAATHFLLSHGLYDKVACRFDVVLVLLNQKTELTWIPNAFN